MYIAFIINKNPSFFLPITFTTMTDLTVLVSPMPLYPSMKQGFVFGRRTPRPASRPIMVTLESEVDPEEPEVADDASQSSNQPHLASPPSSPRRSRSPRFDSSLLSPPVNTWKSKPRPRHRPTRSQSAPPERSVFQAPEGDAEPVPDVPLDLTPVTYVRGASKRSLTAFPSGPSTQGGELIRPPPPLREFFVVLHLGYSHLNLHSHRI